MLDTIKDLIRKKLQTTPQRNHTLIETSTMKKSTKKRVAKEANGMPETKGRKMNKPTRKITNKNKKD